MAENKQVAPALCAVAMLWHLLGIVLLPGMAWLVLGLPMMHAASFSDAFYYFAYAHNFVDLVERYGMIYYAVRFGAIFPDLWFGALLGPMAGFLVLRYLLCVATCGALFFFFSRRYGALVGWFAAAFWMFNPFVLKMMLSPYVTSTAIPFALCGLLLLFMQTQRWMVSRHFGMAGVIAATVAGALFCLSATSNIFAAITIGFGGLAWLAWTAPLGGKPVLLGMCGCVAGAMMTLGCAALVYWRLFDMPNILTPTLDSIISLGSGGSVNWTRPVEEWLVDSPMIFAPPVLSVAGLTLGWKLRERVLLLFSAALAGMTGFYWWLDFFRSGYALSFWPYFQFLLPLIVLVAAESFGTVVMRAGDAGKRWVPVIAMGFIFLGGWQFAKFTFPPVSGEIAWLLAGAGLLCATILVNPRFKSVAWLGVICTCVALMALTGRIPLDPKRAVRDDMSIALAGRELTTIAHEFAANRDCKFWYPGTFEDTVTLVQSAHLNFFSRTGLNAEFPAIDDTMKADLLATCESRLIILGTPDEVDVGLRALEDSEIASEVVSRRKLEYSDVLLDVAVCRVSAVDSYDWRETDLWVPPDATEQGIRVIKKSDFVTGPHLWEGKLLGVVPAPKGETLDAIRLAISVDTGRVQVVVLSADASLEDRELASVQIGRTSGAREVLLTFPSQKERVLLVLQNAWVSGVHSVGLVDAAHIGKLRSPVGK